MLNEGEEVINTALDAMKNISTGITSITDSIGELTIKSDALAMDGQEVKQHISSVVESSHKNKESIQLVSGSITSTVDSLQQLADSSKSLGDAISNL